MKHHILLKRDSYLAMLLCIFLLSSASIKAQCYSTTYRDGTTFTTENPGGLNFNFSNPSGAISSGGSRASAVSLIGLLAGNTYYLKATGFGFTIPSYASICGVRVQIEKRAQGLGLWGAIHDYDVKLVKGGSIVGTNKAFGTDWGTSDAVVLHGGTSDMWGTTLTPADVNAANFGVVISVHIAGVVVVPTAEIDNIKISLDFNPVLPITFAYFNLSQQNKNVSLEWKTAEEEDNSSLILQRSLNNENWTDISKYNLSVQNNDKVYRYEDVSLSPGKFGYRLKIVNAIGTVSYSGIKIAEVKSTSIISVYPNPTTDYITITHLSGTEPITIYDSHGKKWTVVIEKTSPFYTKINTQTLPKGIYYVSAGNQKQKFIRQ